MVLSKQQPPAGMDFEPFVSEPESINPDFESIHKQTKEFSVKYEFLPIDIADIKKEPEYVTLGVEVAKLRFGGDDDEFIVRDVSMLESYKEANEKGYKRPSDFVLQSASTGEYMHLPPMRDGDGVDGYRLTVGSGKSRDTANMFFSEFVSKEHCELFLHRIGVTQGNVAIRIADKSTNGTEIAMSQKVTSLGEVDKVIHEIPAELAPDWDYTSRAEDVIREAINGTDKKRRFEETYSEEPAETEVMYKNRPTIHRDSKINGGVYVVPGNQEAIVVDGEKYQELYNEVFNNLLQLAATERLVGAVATEHDNTQPGIEGLSPSRLSELVHELAVNTIKYDLEYAEEIQEKYQDQKIDLSVMIDDRKGVCRHQALLVAYIFERLINEGRIQGKISVDRNSIKGKGGHAWARFTTEDGEVYIIDPAQHFTGTLRESKSRDGWNYSRPEDNQ